MLSVYLHIPFCQRKCPYCDFNTFAGLDHLYEPFTHALAEEIRLAGGHRGRPQVKTVFLGGGTPTVLPPSLLAQVLATCHQAFALPPGIEISSEANPGTVDASRFRSLRSLGVNRLSIGVQSFDDNELAFLGRIHDAGQAEGAYRAARNAGFTNINLDLIFGLPNQSPATWRKTLQRAIALQPEHLSLYALTIEDGTPFARWADSGRLAYPNPDKAANLYELADELLASAGYVQYEISNWARDTRFGDLEFQAGDWQAEVAEPQIMKQQPESDTPLFACRHNLTYWRNESYLGFGPGAHSSEAQRRWANVNPVPLYISRITQTPASDDLQGAFHNNTTGDSAVTGPNRGAEPWPALDWSEAIDSQLAMGETMMLGLRLTQEGVHYARFELRHGRPLMDVFGKQVSELHNLSLVEVLSDRLRLTPRARLIGNVVFGRFLP